MDLRKLKTLIDLVQASGIAEIEINEEGDHVRIVNRPAQAAQAAPAIIEIPQATPAPAAPAPSAAPAAPSAAPDSGNLCMQERSMPLPHVIWILRLKALRTKKITGHRMKCSEKR